MEITISRPGDKDAEGAVRCGKPHPPSYRDPRRRIVVIYVVCAALLLASLLSGPTGKRGRPPTQAEIERYHHYLPAAIEIAVIVGIVSLAALFGPALAHRMRLRQWHKMIESGRIIRVRWPLVQGLEDMIRALELDVDEWYSTGGFSMQEAVRLLLTDYFFMLAPFAEAPDLDHGNPAHHRTIGLLNFIGGWIVQTERAVRSEELSEQDWPNRRRELFFRDLARYTSLEATS